MDIKSKVPLINVAVGCLVNETHEILIAKRASGRLFSDIWEFPGGKLEHRETYKQALYRELGEELGIILKMDSVTFLLAKTINYNVVKCRLRFFLCQEWIGKVTSVEKQQLSWQKISDLAKIRMLEGNTEVIKLLQDLAFLNKI